MKIIEKTSRTLGEIGGYGWFEDEFAKEQEKFEEKWKRSRADRTAKITLWTIFIIINFVVFGALWVKWSYGFDAFGGFFNDSNENMLIFSVLGTGIIALFLAIMVKVTGKQLKDYERKKR